MTLISYITPIKFTAESMLYYNKVWDIPSQKGVMAMGTFTNWNEYKLIRIKLNSNLES